MSGLVVNQGADAPRSPEPLSADRTMGALGSIAASRIARLFGCGGPSFTCCSEESSSATAVQLAVRALRLGEIDRALVGGVDFTGDPRQLLATSELTGDRTFADGSAALVLKRLSDAERDGDRVYAVIRGVGRWNRERSDRVRNDNGSGRVRHQLRAGLRRCRREPRQPGFAGDCERRGGRT